ncbi:MAG: DUF1573 domain-containing protein [Planctomycetota bacterium]
MSLLPRLAWIAVFVASTTLFAEEPPAEAQSKPAPATKQLPLPEDLYVPALVVEGGLVVNFGEAEKGDLKQVHFVLRNDGAGILKLGTPVADCGCLTPRLSVTDLSKGDRAVMEVGVTTSIIEGEAENKHVIVYSNDPRYPNGLQLQVNGRVVSTIGVRPERVVFDGVKLDTGASAGIEVYDLRAFGLVLQEVATTNTAFAVSFEPAQITVRVKEKEGEKGEEKETEKTYPGYRITVKLTDEAQVGEIDERLVVTTNYPPRARFALPIVGSVVGDFSYKPMGSVYLGSVRVGKTSGKRAVVVTSDIPDFTVSRADATDPALEFQIEKTEKETRVFLTAKGEGRSGRHRAVIRIYREGREKPIITLPVSWRVRGEALAPVGPPEQEQEPTEE